MRERFISTEEFSHLDSASLVLVDHLKGCEALVNAKMDVDHVNHSSQRGAPAQFVRRFGASYEQVSRPHSVGSPGAANLALLEFCRTRYFGMSEAAAQTIRRGTQFSQSLPSRANTRSGGNA
jgi:hypothetical protein